MRKKPVQIGSKYPTPHLFRTRVPGGRVAYEVHSRQPIAGYHIVRHGGSRVIVAYADTFDAAKDKALALADAEAA